MIGLMAMTLSVALTQTPAASVRQTPPHVLAIYADLESQAASRMMVVLRAFVERHPGVAAIEFHLAPPGGELRLVDRAVVAAQAQDAGLRMAELILANPGRRSEDDLVAMSRQLGLDAASFREALARDDVGSAVVADLTATPVKPPQPVRIEIDGLPLSVAPTLADLESRLVVR